MLRPRTLALAASISACLAACAGQAKTPLVDPFPLRFPLVEAGTLEIDGAVAGQPRARDGIVYYATTDGFITAAVAPARGILWRFKADHMISASPELGEGHVIVRDDANTLYVLDTRGSLVFKKSAEEAISTAVRENNGRLFYGTSSGSVVALDLAGGGTPVWQIHAAAVTAGPVFYGDLVIVGAADGRLSALDQAGKLVWEFAAQGRIKVDPAAARGRVYFGTDDRYFYCLSAATGKGIWSRRLQGAPVHPALTLGRRAIVPASNSVIYFLSGRGGTILAWEAVPSRVVYELAAAGPLVLVSSAAPSLAALDPSTGKRAGQHLASDPLMAGALWASPFVVLVEEDQGTGRQRLVFLRSKPASASAAAGPGPSGS